MRRSEMYLEEEVIADLDVIAEEEDVSRASVARSLIDYGLLHQEDIDFGEDVEAEEELEPEEIEEDDIEEGDLEEETVDLEDED
jgi:glycine cleavage system protein P-like pyridoxal-binding family